MNYKLAVAALTVAVAAGLFALPASGAPCSPASPSAVGAPAITTLSDVPCWDALRSHRDAYQLRAELPAVSSTGFDVVACPPGIAPFG
jgi:hypothetical protein